MGLTTRPFGNAKLAIVFGVVHACFFVILSAQSAPDSRYVVKYLNSTQGLLQNSAYAMLQDEFGFVWIATQIGLSRYDGRKFVNWSYEDLAGRSVVRLEEEPYICEYLAMGEDRARDLIFIGACGRLYAISTVADEHWQIPLEGISFIHDLIVDRWGRPVLGTEQGLKAVDWEPNDSEAQFSTIMEWSGESPMSGRTKVAGEKEAGRLASRSVLSIKVLGANCRHWAIGTDQGFFYLAHSHRNHAEVLLEVKSPPVMEVAVRQGDRNGNAPEYWCATRDSVFVYNVVGDLLGKMSQRRVNCMTPVRLATGSDAETMLMGTDYDGLLLGVAKPASENEAFPPGYAVVATAPGATFNWQGMALSNQIGSVMVARDGSIWIGSKGNGLAKIVYRDQVFAHHFRQVSTPGQVANNYVWAIYRENAAANAMWIGTQGNGVVRYDLAQERVTDFYQVDERLDYNIVRTLAVAGDTVWLGGFAGLHYLLPQTAGAQPVPVAGKGTVLERRRVMSLWYEKARRRLWIGMFSGAVGILEGGKVKAAEIPAIGLVTYIGPGKGDSIMVGTDQGFVQFPANRPVEDLVPSPLYLEGVSVKCVIPGRGNEFAWAATVGEGLIRLTRKGDGLLRKDYLLEDGLPDAVVYGILPSETGSLWLSTNRGLSQFFPERNLFVNYEQADGLQHPEYNTGAFFKVGDAFHFGGVNGINVFHESDPAEDPYLPRVALGYFIADPGGKNEQFLLANTEPDAEPAIHLEYDYQYIEFRIAALHYQDFAKVNFRYRLYPEGAEPPEWLLLGTRPSFTLSRGIGLDSKWFFPQRYILEVWASDLRGGQGGHSGRQPNGNSLRVVLSVSPPYWQTWWFILSIFAVGVLIGVLALNLQRQNARLRVRNTDLQTAYRNTAALADLNEIGQKIVASLKLEENFEAILEEIRNLSDLRSDVFAVDLLDEERGVLESRLSIEGSERLNNYKLSLDNPNSFAVACVRMARAGGDYADGFVINDLHNRDQYPFLSGEPAVPQGRPTLAMMFVPLRVGERVLGAVTVQSYAPDVYRAYHLNMLQILGAYTAIAIDHVRTTEALLEAERAKTRAEQGDLIKSLDIKLLRSQLSPHFIFNSLGTIQFLVSEEDPRADDYTARLGEIMREVMMMITRADVTLTTEANFLRGYIAAEVIRFRNEYEFRWCLEIDPDLDPDAVYIPPMLLQPFIENSLEHAFYPLPEGGPEIRVYFGRRNDSLIIVVQDNGIGLAHLEDRKSPGRVRKTSTALQNIRRRAELINQLNQNPNLRMEVRAIDVATADSGSLTPVEKWKLPDFIGGARFELHLPLSFKFTAPQTNE
ncbi:MAG: histidine kinase [Bacteroidota bacterium]